MLVGVAETAMKSPAAWTTVCGPAPREKPGRESTTPRGSRRSTLGILTPIVTTFIGHAISDVVVNDFTDRTKVFPLQPSASSDFTLESAAHGYPGDIAGVAVVAINGATVNPIVLGASACDSGGFASFAVPVVGSSLTPGDQYSVLSARLDAGGQLHLGNQVEIVVQP